MVNDKVVLSIYDHDVGGSNRRYAMVSQSMIQTLERGDEVFVTLHSGSLKGGGRTTFTSFVGIMVGEKASVIAAPGDV